MPDQTEIPVSSFPDAQSINGGDKVTGLQNNSNTNFTFSSILSWLVNAFRAVFVPVTRTVNGKTLDTNITLNASDVGARPSTWTPSVTDIGAQPVITASGILKGDGAGGVAAATAGTDYATPSQIPSVPSAYTSNPTMDGTASPGSSGAWARGDHVHPSDTSRIAATEKGAANGIASLDSTGKVPSSQLPAIPTTAAGVSYDNTASGLDADDVQEAIDELAAGAGGGGVDPETIAPVEDTTTATVAHPLGSIFYLNGILYRALSDIAVGGTINTGAGGNATQTTVAQNFKRTVTLTSAQYSQLSAAEKAADIVYIITDDNAISAGDVEYDNTGSGLASTNVQDAIDEVYGDIPSQASDIGAQDTITASGILKGDGAGGVSAATPGTDYQAPLTAGTDYATPAQLADKAAKADLTSIQATGTTNTTGAAIPDGAYFYLNGILYRAKEQIGTNVPFTFNTNCEQVTVGEDLLKLDKLIAKTPGSGTRDAQLQVGTYNSVATMSFVSLPSRSSGKPDVYVDFAETYIRVYYVKSDGTITTKTYLPS